MPSGQIRPVYTVQRGSASWTLVSRFKERIGISPLTIFVPPMVGSGRNEKEFVP